MDSATRKNHGNVKIERTVNASAFLRSISYFCHEQVILNEKGKTLYIAASMMFSAFSIEAFLNHLGSLRIPSWGRVETRLSPKAKLKRLLKDLQVDVDTPNLDE